MKTFTISIFLSMLAFCSIRMSQAQQIHVPGDYATIQEGISASNPGDTVLVADGLYYENINFLGKKPLMVASHFLIDGDTNHINNTIINGSQPENPNFGSAVTFSSGEDTTSVLCGFTVTGGTGTIETSINYRIGGGVIITYSGGKLLYNHIRDNSIVYNHGVYGGGITGGGPIEEIPWIVLRHNRINNNTAVSTGHDGAGGGVTIYYNAILDENEIINNTINAPLASSGGGVEIGGAFGTIEMKVRNNIIRHNHAISLGASSEYTITAGLCLAWSLTGIVSGNDISFNDVVSADVAWGQGTGVLVQEAITDEFVFENNFITNNTHQGQWCLGGGMLLYNTGGKFQNNIIRDNQGTHGGGLTIQDCTEEFPVLINNTITGNMAESQGGGLYLDNADAVVINSIIWGNSAPDGASIYQGSGGLEVVYSDVEGNDVWHGEGNVLMDPDFLDDTCHIHENSLCEDHGTYALYIGQTLYEIPEYDFEGDVRPYHMGIDIGADECDIIEGVDESAVGGRRSVVTCYPNPTSGIVDLRFTVYDLQSISLKVYNVQGQEVAVVLDEMQTPGEHNVRWDAGPLPAGIYCYRLLTADRRPLTGKIVKY